MFKRIISSIMLPCILNLILPSCSGQDLTGSSERRTVFENPEFTNSVLADPGRVHNEILGLIDAEHPLAGGGSLSREEFKDLFVRSANSVLARRGFGIELRGQDVEYVLAEFDVFREKGVFDFYTPPPDRAPGDIVPLLDHIERRGEIGPPDFGIVRRRLETAAGIGHPPPPGSGPPEITDAADASRTSQLNTVLDLASHSRAFWSSLGAGPGAPEMPGSRKTPPPARVDLVTINSYLWDALGAIIFWQTGPGAVIAGTIASCVYIAIVTQNEGSGEGGGGIIDGGGDKAGDSGEEDSGPADGGEEGG